MAEDGRSPDGAVVPLDPDGSGDGTTSPWELLATGRGALIEWSASTTDGGEGWGPALNATSELARQLTTIASRAGASSAVLNGASLFTLELPTGSTLQNLVPALGGGFRGMVRSGGSAISGHARLVPVTGVGVGAGAGLALGPLVALLGLAVGAEMLARHQQDKKLDAILQTGLRIEQADYERTDAQLASAVEALEQGRAALLDKISIPSSIGLGTARNNLRDIRHRAMKWLDEWERGLRKLPPRKNRVVDLEVMDRVLGGGSGQLNTFPRRVAILYESLCLDSRAQVLTSIESALANPEVHVHHLESELHKALKQNAEAQERLRGLLWRIAERPVRPASFFASGSREEQADRLSATLSRLAEAAARLPDAPAILTQSNRQVIQLRRTPDGGVQVLQPQAQAAALA
ncbi:hypothetical protein GCM10027053_00040 [Intrasporangium mesophilum]